MNKYAFVCGGKNFILGEVDGSPSIVSKVLKILIRRGDTQAANEGRL
ncbi:MULTISPECIES: hypothetical protein [Maribacter]|uniref:Uncharacterized protein n=1 Tax=Maribacter flavus TaxID=1658664 RepID=A0ABU7IM19_9FLAO|nr:MULTISPECIES: hypothetical protein [Maribacter]MDC6406885.1 hypothetical protein [Maribacter sp. PR66]MEE1974003.1 hypothetical protein [Maribacter flavus]